MNLAFKSHCCSGAAFYFIGVLTLLQTPLLIAGESGLWARVHTSDPAALVENLREAGFPPDTIGLLVSREVNMLYAEREKAMEPPNDAAETEREWWTPERSAARLDLLREKRVFLRGLLGHLPDSHTKTDWAAQSYPRLTIGEQDAVRAIIADYDELLESLRATTRGHVNRDDIKMELFVEQGRGNDLAEYLTPEEIDDYQIQHTPLGQKLRYHLEGFEPTQVELRTAMRVMIERELAVDYLLPTFSYPDHLRAQAIRKAFVAGMKEELTPERFEHFRLTSSPLYRPTFMLVRRLGQPNAIAEQIFKSQLGLSATEEEIRPYIGPADQMPVKNFDRFPVLVENHCELVRSLLGEDGYSEYLLQNSSWIERLRNEKPCVFRLD